MSHDVSQRCVTCVRWDHAGLERSRVCILLAAIAVLSSGAFCLSECFLSSLWHSQRQKVLPFPVQAWHASRGGSLPAAYRYLLHTARCSLIGKQWFDVIPIHMQAWHASRGGSLPAAYRYLLHTARCSLIETQWFDVIPIHLQDWHASRGGSLPSACSCVLQTSNCFMVGTQWFDVIIATYCILQDAL